VGRAREGALGAAFRTPAQRRADRVTRAEPTFTQRLTAEAVGTFVLTLVAAGADVLDGVTAGGIGHTARYLAPGLVVAALIFTLSGVSGAHINPAVTLAFLARRVLPLRDACAYWLVQLAGGIGAGLTLRAIFGERAHYGATRMNLALPAIDGLAIEAILTAILVLVILGTLEQKAVVGKNAAIAVGFTIAALGLCASPISGASMNPARSLGPSIATLSFTDWWLYLAGPVAGALVACALVQLIYGSATDGEQEAAKGKDAANV
jgi:aquaporin Z